MTVIRPISDLRNKTPGIEEICINEQIPVFITKNGSGNLVIMSQQLFEEQQALLDLYGKLDEAEEQSCAGKRRPFHDVMVDMRSRIHAKASISITEAAEQDLAEIVWFIASDNPVAAVKLAETIEQCIIMLEDFPLTG